MFATAQKIRRRIMFVYCPHKQISKGDDTLHPHRDQVDRDVLPIWHSDSWNFPSVIKVKFCRLSNFQCLSIHGESESTVCSNENSGIRTAAI